MVLFETNDVVCSVGEEGLMKAVSFPTCLIMPLGCVFCKMDVCMISPWCTAWINLKYSLAACLVASSGAWPVGRVSYVPCVLCVFA